MKLLLAVAVALAGLAGLATLVPRAAAAAPAAAAAAALAEPLIIFSSDRNGPWAIWAIKPDGTQARALTKPAAGGEENDVDPVFSPDGASILFTSTRKGTPGLWRMARDGGNLQRLCDGDQGEWSPDGRKLAFRRAGRLFTRDLATSAEKAVTPEGWDKCSGPAWSPDGNRLAFAVLGAGANALYTIAAAGGAPTKVYDQQGACEPHFSPDGKLLIYETETHLCTINPDGTKNRLLTYFGGVQRYGRYSPDGKQIVFCQAASPTGPWELYVIPATGGTPARLTEGGSDMYPDWR